MSPVCSLKVGKGGRKAPALPGLFSSFQIPPHVFIEVIIIDTQEEPSYTYPTEKQYLNNLFDSWK